MTVVLRVHGVATAGRERDFVSATWVKSFDPEAFDGRGDAILTDKPGEALEFSDFVAAMEFWQTVPECRPTRPDGKPNRPLTAFTVETEERPPLYDQDADERGT